MKTYFCLGVVAHAVVVHWSSQLDPEHKLVSLIPSFLFQPVFCEHPNTVPISFHIHVHVYSTLALEKEREIVKEETALRKACTLCMREE